MPNVDQKQTIVSDDHIKTDITFDQFREKTDVGDRFTCVIRLSNGFEAVGTVEKTYATQFSDEQAQSLAHQRALDYVEKHGYTLV